jgi:hypothetical protein
MDLFQSIADVIASEAKQSMAWSRISLDRPGGYSRLAMTM